MWTKMPGRDDEKVKRPLYLGADNFLQRAEQWQWHWFNVICRRTDRPNLLNLTKGSTLEDECARVHRDPKSHNNSRKCSRRHGWECLPSKLWQHLWLLCNAMKPTECNKRWGWLLLYYCVAMQIPQLTEVILQSKNTMQYIIMLWNTDVYKT